MIRMTLALSALLYGALLVWGDPVPQAVASSAGADADAAVAAVRVAGAGPARPTIVEPSAVAAPQVTRAATSNAAAPAPTTIASAAAIGEPRLVSLIAPAAAAEAPAVGLQALVSEDAAAMLRVTGSRVNMRAGPSTTDAVVTSLPGGTLAEPVGEPVGGWVRIRVPETGATGFMSANFLEPA